MSSNLVTVGEVEYEYFTEDIEVEDNELQLEEHESVVPEEELEFTELEEYSSNDDAEYPEAVFIDENSVEHEDFIEEQPRPTATAEDVAQWMKEKLILFDHVLPQRNIVFTIRRVFGEHFTYTNKNNNYGIVREVLLEFRKLTPEYVWSRRNQHWRLREADEDPNKRLVP